MRFYCNHLLSSKSLKTTFYLCCPNIHWWLCFLYSLLHKVLPYNHIVYFGKRTIQKIRSIILISWIEQKKKTLIEKSCNTYMMNLHLKKIRKINLNFNNKKTYIYYYSVFLIFTSAPFSINMIKSSILFCSTALCT